MASAVQCSAAIHQPPDTETMDRKGYYSPPLKRETVTRMFHEAKSRKIPMTRLNDMLVEDGLNRLQRREEQKLQAVKTA